MINWPSTSGLSSVSRGQDVLNLESDSLRAPWGDKQALSGIITLVKYNTSTSMYLRPSSTGATLVVVRPICHEHFISSSGVGGVGSTGVAMSVLGDIWASQLSISVCWGRGGSVDGRRRDEVDARRDVDVDVRREAVDDRERRRVQPSMPAKRAVTQSRENFTRRETRR